MMHDHLNIKFNIRNSTSIQNWWLIKVQNIMPVCVCVISFVTVVRNIKYDKFFRAMYDK